MDKWPEGFARLRIEELREECSKRELSTSGTKEEMKERIKVYVQQAAGISEELLAFDEEGENMKHSDSAMVKEETRRRASDAELIQMENEQLRLRFELEMRRERDERDRKGERKRERKREGEGTRV